MLMFFMQQYKSFHMKHIPWGTCILAGGDAFVGEIRAPTRVKAPSA